MTLSLTSLLLTIVISNTLLTYTVHCYILFTLILVQTDLSSHDKLFICNIYKIVLVLVYIIILIAHHFLHLQRIAQIIVQRSKIIHAVSHHQRLMIRLGFSSLLDAGMQETN